MVFILSQGLQRLSTSTEFVFVGANISVRPKIRYNQDLFATSFAMLVARIELGLQKELLHGNLDPVRTLIDVRDAMASYWTAMLKCRPGEAYNIGGNTVIKVGEFLDILKKVATCAIPSRVDSKLLRPADVTLQIPNVEKFKQTTGWQPKYTFEESVEHLLNHCRERVKK